MFFLLPLLGEALLLVGAAACGAVAVGTTVCLGLAFFEDLFKELADAEGQEQARVEARVREHLAQKTQELLALDHRQRSEQLAQMRALAASPGLSPQKRQWLNAQLRDMGRELGA